MSKRSVAIGLSLNLWASAGFADGTSADAERQVQTFVYRPEVFADQRLGVGLPADTRALDSYLWYVRFEEPARSFLGAAALARFLQDHRIPGVDFTNDRTLTSADVERLLQAASWSGASEPYRLRLLKLAGTLVDDQALPGIGKRYELEVLELGGRVSDRGLPWLKNLAQLKVLELSGAAVTDASAPAIATLKGLQRLGLKGTQISDRGLKRLAPLGLKHLLLGARVTNRGLRGLAAMTTLRQLDVSQGQVTGPGLAALANAPIHTLFVGSSVTDGDVPALAALRRLRRLDMTGARVADAAAKDLSSMTGLEELALSGTAVGDRTIEALAKLPHLRYLEVSDTQVTPEVFARVQGFPALQVISLTSRHALSRRDLAPFARLGRLHSVLINGVLFGSADLRAAAAVDGPRAWRRLRWPPEAFAGETPAAEDHVDQALKLASAPPAETRTPFAGFQGLKRIHEAESSLDTVSDGGKPAAIHEFEDNEKNFLGEITVGAAPPPGKHEKAPVE